VACIERLAAVDTTLPEASYEGATEVAGKCAPLWVSSILEV
jgi:hypothetical protein